MNFFEKITFVNLPMAQITAMLFSLIVVCWLILIFLRFFNKTSGGALSALLGRLLIAACALLVLAKPEITKPKLEQGEITLLVDYSESFSPTERNNLISQVIEVGFRKIKVIPFATEADKPYFEPLKEPNLTAIKPNKTNLEKALAYALQNASGDLLLISDGLQNTGDLNRLLHKIKNGNLKIHPLIAEQSLNQRGRVKISSLTVPQFSERNSKIDLSLVINNSTNSAQSGTLIISQNGGVISEEKITLSAKSDSVVSKPSGLISDSEQEGFEVVFRPDNQSISPSINKAYSSKIRRQKILLLRDEPEESKYLEQVLKESAFELDVKRPSETPANLSDYKLLVINNLPYNLLPQGFALKIRDFVKQGGKLYFIGGNRSYGAGGYINTNFEDLLPVKLLPPKAKEKRSNVAVALVIDKSRSMSEGNRLDFAKEAASSVVNLLKDNDYLGVIGFDSTPFIIIKLAQVASVRENASDRIARLFPAGRTYLFPALDEARRALERAPAGRKHILILTDGQLPDAGPIYSELVKHLKSKGVTTSTVLVGGGGDDQFLKDLAEIGGGQHYFARDPANLPRIFISDVKVISNEKATTDDLTAEVRNGASANLPFNRYPNLNGFVETAFRKEAKNELILRHKTSGTDYPLLASWQIGEGGVTAFTSDLSGRWSGDWIEWREFRAFLRALFGETINSDSRNIDDNNNFLFAHNLSGDRLLLDLTTFQESNLENAMLLLPNGGKQKIDFKRSAPIGKFSAETVAAEAGKYELTIQTAGSKPEKISFYLPPENFLEDPNEPINLELLEKIAAFSGGKINPNLELLAHSNQVESLERRSLEKFILGLTLITYLLQVIFSKYPVSLLKRKSFTLN
ncbi:MAG TPA: VWA domain-containing protein [Oligoflexia bacterium]|nr:VWA domain-containing protein [Oligoflexia bacterium]HMP26454.1 VWA domain-containing protein [Oligoflexia bacterium]